MKIVLASASPRRAMLLRQIGVDFVVKESRFAELTAEKLPPEELARQNAIGKAVSVYRDGSPPVLAADTAVAIGNEVFGKPCGTSDAMDMLRRLSGREHRVITGVCLIYRGKQYCLSETTRVLLRLLTEGEIAAYVATGESFGKAGSYAIQGLGALLVKKIDGCYSNVVGLPLMCVVELLKEAGINFAYKKSAAG